MKYDGRWAKVAQAMISEYGLTKHSIVLQINCEKGYLLADLSVQVPGMKIVGIEPSSYARNHAPDAHTRSSILPSWKFDVEAFDLVIALGVVYTFNLPDAIQCLRKIDRLGHRSFITLAAYETEEDLRLFRAWTLLGTTILKKDEWIEVMKHAGYSSDYSFVTAETLRLREG
jgi:protein-L-isoaspartate(D-aspartate) O-methyltransferase